MNILKKTLQWFSMLSILIGLTCPSVFPFGCVTTGGAAPQTCDAKSWNCNAYKTCYTDAPANQYQNFPTGSPEYNAALASYKACSKPILTECMAKQGCPAAPYYWEFK